MPKFRIEFIHEGEDQIRTAEAEFATGFKDLTFSRQYLDWEEQYYLQHDEQLIETKAIVALEDLPDYGVLAGDIVWRDWMDLDVMSDEGAEQARKLVQEFKPVWDDPGLGFNFLMELLAPPEPWELGVY